MNIEFSGDVWYWRGPAPFHFLTVPEPESEQIASVAGIVSYGWGVIPVAAQIDEVHWTTSLFPKDGGYIVPVKDKVRSALDIEVGDVVTVRLSVEA